MTSDRQDPEPRQVDVGTTGDWPEETMRGTVGPVRMDEPSAEELGQAAMSAANQAGNLNDKVSAARTDKFVHNRWPDLNDDDLAHLPVLHPGTALEQGSVYFDLSHPERGPFKAIGGQSAEEGDRIVAKNQVDSYLWNRIVPDDQRREADPHIERPPREEHGVANEAEQG
jgi:hypothetical protein